MSMPAARDRPLGWRVSTTSMPSSLCPAAAREVSRFEILQATVGLAGLVRESRSFGGDGLTMGKQLILRQRITQAKEVVECSLLRPGQ